MVVTGLNEGKIHAFLADEGLARFCTEPYQKPSKDNLSKVYMHLTNYSLNKIADNFIDETDVEDIMEPNHCSKRTLTALWKQIEEEHGDVVGPIKENIK